MSDLSIPQRLANGLGNWPDADKIMDNFDFLTALLAGSFLLNGGEESWGTTTFSSPANGTTLNSSWVSHKSGTTPPTFTIDREGTIKDSGTYAKRFNITVAGSADYLIGDKQVAQNITLTKGYTVAFGRRVYAGTANKVRLRVTDGTTTAYSSYHSGSGAWEGLTVKLAVASAATVLTVELDIVADFTGAVYADNAFAYIVPASISNQSLALLGYQTARELGALYLALSGGTMSGPIAMGSSKITGLAAATVNGDAVRYDEFAALGGGLNILDNGGFDIWQRGITFSAPADTSHTADRWKTSTNEAANVTVTKETTTVDSGLPSMKVVVASAGASKYWMLNQIVENYADYRGRTVTLSVRVFCSVAGAISLRIGDGYVNGQSSYHTGGGGWETLTVTQTINAATAALYVGIGMINAGDKKAGTYYFDSAILTIGTSAAFIPTHPGVDLTRCQRFAWVLGGTVTSEYLALLQATSTTAATGPYRFPVAMRVAPTATVNNVTHLATSRASGIGAFDFLSALTIDGLTPQGCRLTATTTTLVAGNATILFTTNADASVVFSADL